MLVAFFLIIVFSSLWELEGTLSSSSLLLNDHLVAFTILILF